MLPLNEVGVRAYMYVVGEVAFQSLDCLKSLIYLFFMN